MAIVGPRPEREYYIEKIVEGASLQTRIKSKPGITSWGQIKFGYAENVDEMVARLKFDLLYVENMSLSLDVKSFLYCYYNDQRRWQIVKKYLYLPKKFMENIAVIGAGTMGNGIAHVFAQNGYK